MPAAIHYWTRVGSYPPPENFIVEAEYRRNQSWRAECPWVDWRCCCSCVCVSSRTMIVINTFSKPESYKWDTFLRRYTTRYFRARSSPCRAQKYQDMAHRNMTIWQGFLKNQNQKQTLAGAVLADVYNSCFHIGSSAPVKDKICFVVFPNIDFYCRTSNYSPILLRKKGHFFANNLPCCPYLVFWLLAIFIHWAVSQTTVCPNYQSCPSGTLNFSASMNWSTLGIAMF